TGRFWEIQLETRLSVIVVFYVFNHTLSQECFHCSLEILLRIPFPLVPWHRLEHRAGVVPCRRRRRQRALLPDHFPHQVNEHVATRASARQRPRTRQTANRPIERQHPRPP